MRFGVANMVTMALAVCLAAGLFFAALATNQANRELQSATEDYIACENAADDMEDASSYLTSQARMFVLTQTPTYLQRYLSEENDLRRRERAQETLTQLSQDVMAQRYLADAMKESDELLELERYAMKLAVVAANTPDDKGASALSDVELTADDAALDKAEKLGKANQLLFDDSYSASRDHIIQMVSLCRNELTAGIQQKQEASRTRLHTLLVTQTVLAILLLIVVVATILGNIVLALRPLKSYTEEIHENKPLEPSGSAELRLLAHAYNVMYEENERHSASLLHEAEHDPLTGLLNRNAFNKLYEEHLDKQALLLIDLDKFKYVNDDYGHDVGDKVLCIVASVLHDTFRASDLPCRIGGDEFAVIMSGVTPELKHVVEARVSDIVAALEHADSPVPITLSIGIAFSEDAHGEVTVFKAADLALYSVKEAGRNGHAFYSDIAR